MQMEGREGQSQSHYTSYTNLKPFSHYKFTEKVLKLTTCALSY